VIPPIPFLDVDGYKRRSKIVRTDIDFLVAREPGWLQRRIAYGSSRINARLQKRYAVPLGQASPALVAAGTAPPPVSLLGRAAIGSLEIALRVTSAGALGVPFDWSVDGGMTFPNVGVVSAPLVPLGPTGFTAQFPPGPYAADNTYNAPAPIPEIVLGWLVAMLDVDCWEKRGINAAGDGQYQRAVDEMGAALSELKEAADSKEGLFELPTNDVAGDSAVTQGGPMFYSEQSPFVWMDQQRQTARSEDRAHTGTTETADK
jgi:hypothetical protein